MTKGLSEDELIIIVCVAAAVLALLVIISVLICVYCCKKGKNKTGEKTPEKCNDWGSECQVKICQYFTLDMHIWHLLLSRYSY